jgi:hypothetical protein
MKVKTANATEIPTTTGPWESLLAMMWRYESAERRKEGSKQMKILNEGINKLMNGTGSCFALSSHRDKITRITTSTTRKIKRNGSWHPGVRLKR